MMEKHHPADEITSQTEAPAGFSPIEMSFFAVGTALESGEMPIADDTEEIAAQRDPRTGVRRWVRRSPGLAVGWLCAVLLVVGLWVGSGHGVQGPLPAIATTRAVGPAVPVDPPAHASGGQPHLR